jgi:glycerol-3-phosphate dehydrogenase subunit B
VTYDTVVIGAGLAGLTAALRLADQGQRVLVVAKGVGATHLAPATIDVLGYHDGTVASPARALPAFTAANPDHPYGHLPLSLIRASLEWFKARTDELGYRGSLDENVLLPTAVGVAKPAALVPEAMAAGDLRRGGRFVFVGLRGLKDFYASYLADNLSRAEMTTGTSLVARAIEVAPPLGEEGDVGTLGFARRFEQPSFRESLLRELDARIDSDEVVGFPAVLGHRAARTVRQELETKLGRPVFEVATLPPSVSGIRLFETMTSALRRAGGRLIVGSAVVGAAGGTGRIEAVEAQALPRSATYSARSFVLATGGFASGGLDVDSFGNIRETVFGLPLGNLPASGRPRFAPEYFEEHALARTGVAVGKDLRPLDGDGVPVRENVHVAGTTLAGAIPWREASGNGLSVATGYAAAAAILERSS